MTAFASPDVRLEDGPFRRAQSLDERYLLQLDPDRLVHGFRVNAGLVPKAPVYGGWESEETWADIRCQGHTLGHYLSACVLMFASSGQPEFKRRVDHIVEELSVCQGASNGGFICAFPDGALQLRNSVNGGNVQGVPWYTMHKIFAGLRDAHAHGGSEPALEILIKLSDWTWNLVHELSDAQLDQMLEPEHGGMNEVLADVYDLTGDEKYLTLARKFCHRALLAPMAAGRDVLDGLHAGEDLIANERTYGEVLDRRVDVPAWLGRPQNFPGSVVASGEGSLTFRARGFEHGKEVELVPYYRIAHERYNLYWSARESESGVPWG